MVESNSEGDIIYIRLPVYIKSYIRGFQFFFQREKSYNLEEFG